MLARNELKRYTLKKRKQHTLNKARTNLSLTFKSTSFFSDFPFEARYFYQSNQIKPAICTPKGKEKKMYFVLAVSSVSLL